MTPQYEPQTLQSLFSSRKATAATCAPGPEPSAEAMLENETNQINMLLPTNVTRQKALLAVIITRSPALTHSGVSQIRHAALRRYWGQPAQRMKQMKSFRRDVYNPVLLTVLRPPRRL